MLYICILSNKFDLKQTIRFLHTTDPDRLVSPLLIVEAGPQETPQATPTRIILVGLPHLRSTIPNLYFAVNLQRTGECGKSWCCQFMANHKMAPYHLLQCIVTLTSWSNSFHMLHFQSTFYLSLKFVDCLTELSVASRSTNG